VGDIYIYRWYMSKCPDSRKFMVRMYIEHVKYIANIFYGQ
jgi:hypothetical protein